MQPSLVTEIIIGLATVISTAVTSFIIIKVTLARHDERISNMEKDIHEIKAERQEIHNDMKNIFKLVSKINTTVAVLDERTKKG